MYKTIILAAGLLLSGAAMAQPNLVHQADSLKKAGDLVSAYQCYRLLHRQHPEQPQHAYALAQIAALMYSPAAADSGFYYLEKALSQDTTVQALMDPELYYLSTDARWAALEQRQVAKYEVAHGPLPLPEFASALWAMIRRDQALRYFQRPMERQIRQGNPIPVVLYPLTYFGVQVRAQNLPELERLIAEYGWPRNSDFPDQTAHVATLIINHSDHLTRKRYLPMMEEAMAQGEIDPLRYAQVKDRVLLDNGRRQWYGTQQTLKRDGSLWPEPIKQPRQVDERRAAIG
ncbi:MAG TPA: hypothetical protein DCR93_33080, partial [Cytophagales bacterium]|nr:hypothetical protein [Cytophagales bacterium]